MAFDPSLADAIHAAWLADEGACVKTLAGPARLDVAESRRVCERAARWVMALRNRRTLHPGLETFLREFSLSSNEGLLLMGLAESLLRIPDAATGDRLIADLMARGDWERHLGRSDSVWVNASAWGLALTGSLVRFETGAARTLLEKLFQRGTEVLLRQAIRQAMHLVAGQFVLGRDLEEALSNSAGDCRYSYDMLGEAALTRDDARGYFDAYAGAIAALRGQGEVFAAPGISIKLSALHPRHEFAQGGRVMKELLPLLHELMCMAKERQLLVTLDAEESERLELSLHLFAALARDANLKHWQGLGLAVQAYQKRAPAVIGWLARLAQETGRTIPLRLVKGAYWDSEIKRAQQLGLAGYPVYTRKAHTDIAYLACAKQVLAAGAAFHPQFASHNAHTLSWVLHAAGGRDIEFQRLHGMGESLYATLREDGVQTPLRIYAPVGSHEALLPYLVRRLLENGANTSFVGHAVDVSLSPEQVAADPVTAAGRFTPNPRIPLPGHIVPGRRMAPGLNLADGQVVAELLDGMQALPALASLTPLESALAEAGRAFVEWSARPVAERAAVLERAADLLEARYPAFMGLLVREGRKTLPDALAEAREAADYCRYYAQLAREQFAAMVLPGPTGESNTLALHGRGVFACISPWNFPLAICLGQVVAALVAGNTVVAKPASQTPQTAAAAVGLLHEAGVPREALHLLAGSGSEIGTRLMGDARIAGVAFTGSTETAQLIQQRLTARGGPLVPLIAETGGQNALIADSSALPEQVVRDALASAFNSAGQRCSALRVLCVQEDIAPRLIALLKGAMDELAIGDPALLATDIGPVIDAAARAKLDDHARRLRAEGRVLHEVALPAGLEGGHYVAPLLAEIPAMSYLGVEVFGPVLHLLRFRIDALDELVDAINATGYGLTLGVHSRIEGHVRRVVGRARVGNVYVNRNQIGAVVGMQPFGGEGLSGTGFKAGGPHYLLRFATERTVSVNTAAVGGNLALLGEKE